MDAAAERQRAHVGARDVEPVGVGVDAGVAIGRTEQAYDRLAPGQRDTANLVDIFERGAASDLDGRIITQNFFDGAGGEGSSRRSLSWWGLRCRARRPLPIRFTVVS
jgi:hypothetical protein